MDRPKREPKKPQFYTPEAIRITEKKARKREGEDKKKQMREISELEIKLDNTDIINDTQHAPKNMKLLKLTNTHPPNLGFKKIYTGNALTFSKNEDIREAEEIFQAEREIKQMKPLRDISEGHVEDFMEMVRAEEHKKSEPYKEFIRRKYFPDTFRFEIDDIQNHMIKLKLINEAIGNQREIINTFLQNGEFITELRTKWGEGTGQHEEEMENYKKATYLILCILTSLHRLKIINKQHGNTYVPLKLSPNYDYHVIMMQYIQDFAALSLYCLGIMGNIKTITPLTDMFDVFKRYGNKKGIYKQWDTNLKNFMDMIFPELLETIMVELKSKWWNAIKNLNFDDTDDFYSAIKTVGEYVGYALLQNPHKEPVKQAIDDGEGGISQFNPERALDRTGRPPLEKNDFAQRNLVGKPYTSQDATYDRLGYKVDALSRKLVNAQGEIGKRSREEKGDAKVESKRANYGRGFGGGKVSKDLEKLLKKKNKDSYKYFKIIDKLEIKLKKLVEKILELEKKKKELQKKCKKTKSKKDKKMVDNILKRIKKEKDNKKKLKNDISKNKKHSKIILKELKQIDKKYKKIKQNGGDNCGCSKKIKNKKKGKKDKLKT